MKKNERDAEIIRRWLQRPQSERTMNDVFDFNNELQQKGSSLLYGIPGDPYQQLKSILRRHIRE